MLGATAAAAQQPQELEQLEPGRHELQFESQSLLRPTDGDAGSAHSVSVGYGISDRLALGLELEGERSGAKLGLENVDFSILYRLVAPNPGSLNTGIKMSVGINRHGEPTQTEIRFIVEQIGSEWWLQGNIIAEHEREKGSSNNTLAYIASASHNIVSNFWLGLEVSGSISGLGGTGEFERGHFIGPSASAEYELREGLELEVGAVYLTSLAGIGPAKSARLFVQLNFD